MDSAVPGLVQVNLFVRDLQRACSFYAELFGFEELTAARSPIFRGLLAGPVLLGFSSGETYARLNLPAALAQRGVAHMLTFNVRDSSVVDKAVESAVRLDASLLKAAAATAYGRYQAVLLDPEGNAFRIESPIAGS